MVVSVSHLSCACCNRGVVAGDSYADSWTDVVPGSWMSSIPWKNEAQPSKLRYIWAF